MRIKRFISIRWQYHFVKVHAHVNNFMTNFSSGKIHWKGRRKSPQHFNVDFIQKTSSTCMIFRQSLKQYINHIPRWWARVFFEYKIISYSLFILRFGDVRSSPSLYNKFIPRIPSLASSTLSFEGTVFVVQKINILWTSKIPLSIVFGLGTSEQS